jgi:hypothetical protein
LLGIRASSPSKNAYAKPDLRSSGPQTVKGAAARLASLGPDGPPLTVWLRFALGQRRVARTRNPWMSRGFCRSAAAAHRAWMTRSDPEARSARLQACSEDSLSTIDSPHPRLCQEVRLWGSRVIALATERERAGVSSELLRLRSRSDGGDAPTLGLSSHASAIFVLLASAKVPMMYPIRRASYRRERSERTPR